VYICLFVCLFSFCPSIDSSGFQLFLNGVKESQIKELVKKYDVNGDGKISYEEFLQVLSSRSAVDPYDEVSEVDDDCDDYGRLANIADEAGEDEEEQEFYRRPSPRPSSNSYNSHNKSTNNDHIKSRPAAREAWGMAQQAPTSNNQQQQKQRPPPQQQQPQQLLTPSQVARHYGSDDQSVGLFSDVASDIVPPSDYAPSTVNPNNANELEHRAKSFIAQLRVFLMKKASDMRLNGRVRMPVAMTQSELHESVARGIISKAFQPYSGENDGRVRGSARETGVEFPEFARVLRSCSFPGMTPLRTETIQYLFEICSLSDSGGALLSEHGTQIALASQLVDLVFGSSVAWSTAQRKERAQPQVDPRQVRGCVCDDYDFILLIDLIINIVCVLVQQSQGKVDPITGRLLKNFIAKVDSGRETVARGPFNLPSATDAKRDREIDRAQQLLAVPLRFVSRKSRTALAAPSHFDSSLIQLSNTLPDFDLSR
jgi:hypothetical protein